MDSQRGLGQKQVEGAAREKRRESKRDGGSGGLIVGIATVVVVGVAGKLFQRFNSLNSANNARGMDSMDETTASEQRQSGGAVLKKVLSIVGDHQTHDRGSNAPSIEAASDVENKYNERRSSILLSADPAIFVQDSLSEDSDSKCAQIQLKYPLDKFDTPDHEGEVESPGFEKLDPVLATDTTLGELVGSSVKHEVPSDAIETLSKAEDLQHGIAEVISRAFEGFGRREELSGQEQVPPKKLTVQLVWDDKPEPNEADTAKIADSVPGSETTVHCDAKDNSDGFTYAWDSGNVVSVFVDPRDTDLSAAADDIKPENSAETEIEVSRINSEVSASEVSDWPQPITFQEFISSVQASTRPEMEDQVTEDVSLLADSVAEEQGNSFPLLHSEEDLDYSACKGPSAVHDEAENEAESVFTECEVGPSSQSQEAICRENEVGDVSTQTQQDKKESESLEILKAAVGEHFEESLSSLEVETKTISSANVDEKEIETELDTSLVHSEEEMKHTTSTSAAKDALLVESTDGSSGFSPIKEVGAGEITLQNDEVAVGKNGVNGNSSVVLPKSSNAGDSFKHSRLHNVADSSSADITKGAIMTTMEYPSLANKYGIFKQLEVSRDRSASEVLRMAVFIALIAAIIFMIREQHLKPLKHTA